MPDDGDNVITLADGTVISTRTGRPVRATNGVPSGYVAVPTNSEAVRAVTRVRRRIADLPDVPARMNVIGVIAAYHLFGMDDFEIALALGCTEGQVGNIKTTTAFGDLIDTMQRNLVDGAQEDVRSFLYMQSKRAAEVVAGMLDSEDDQVATVAAKDILDRAGHRPVDVVEHRHRVEGGLTIEYVRKGERDDDLPIIDMQVEDT